jgi:hypothetical protein
MNTMWKRVAVIIAVLIPVAVVGAFVMKQDKDTDPVAADTTKPAVTTPAASTGTDTGTGTTTSTATGTGAAAMAYVNGAYTALGEYNTPDGLASITVKLTVGNDVVTQVEVTSTTADPASKMWQEKFIGGVQAEVVGKKLASLHLTKVSGSSLTPIGFNAAVSDIQNQAKS